MEDQMQNDVFFIICIMFQGLICIKTNTFYRPTFIFVI